MNYPPEIQKAVEAETRARALAWLTSPPDLCGFPIRHLTPRMRLELEVAGNAFAVYRFPRRHDVFAFLWRLSPAYAPMRAPQALQRRGAWRFLGRLVLAILAFRRIGPAMAFWRLERAVKRGALVSMFFQILEYRKQAYRDRPPVLEESDKPRGLIPPSAPHWCDGLVAFFGEHFAMSRDEVLDAPFVHLYQIWRARAIARGIDIVDEVAEIAGDYARRALESHRGGQAASN